MKIKEAMNKIIIVISPNTTPLEAFQKMHKDGVRRLFVMNKSGTIIGVVSYSDLVGILGSIKPNQEGNNIKISDIMSEDIMTISADDRIEDAANLMVRADISGLLVMEDKKPVGVITKTDICRLVAAELLIPI